MRVTKRSAGQIRKEDAHGGSGSRKVFADKSHMKSPHFDAMTHGYLPAGKSFDWHNHQDTEEIMVVIGGEGFVEDEDGKYPYAPGDVFIFPANVEHKITNPSDAEHEMMFVRIAS